MSSYYSNILSGGTPTPQAVSNVHMEPLYGGAESKAGDAMYPQSGYEGCTSLYSPAGSYVRYNFDRVEDSRNVAPDLKLGPLAPIQSHPTTPNHHPQQSPQHQQQQQQQPQHHPQAQQQQQHHQTLHPSSHHQHPGSQQPHLANCSPTQSHPQYSLYPNGSDGYGSPYEPRLLDCKNGEPCVPNQMHPFYYPQQAINPMGDGMASSPNGYSPMNGIGGPQGMTVYPWMRQTNGGKNDKCHIISG